jgi:hypothetical protein
MGWDAYADATCSDADAVINQNTETATWLIFPTSILCVVARLAFNLAYV